MPATGNNSLHTYRMSICLAADGFSLSVSNPSGGNSPLQAEEHYGIAPGMLAQELHRALTRPRIMDYRYASVEIVTDTPSTFLPLEDFRSSEVPSIYRLCFPQAEVRSEDIRYELLSAQEIVVLFTADARCVQAVQRLYPEATLRSWQGRLLEEASEAVRRIRGSARHLFVNIGRERMCICMAGKGTPPFACAYEATEEADQLYYILSVWKALDLDATRDVLHVQGVSDSLHERLSQYIQEIL